MMQSEFMFILALSFLFFIAGFVRKEVESMALFTISAALFLISAAASVQVDVITATGITSYTGSAVFGLIALGFAIISGGLALSRLEEVI